MTVRLLLNAALVANILVLVICTDNIDDVTSAESSSHVIFKTRPKKCIRVKRCPKNEEFSYCPQSLRRAQYCSEKGQPLRNLQPDRGPCKEACVCKETFLRAENGTCIPAKKCPITCGPNEVVDKCPADCESDYCPTSDEDTEECTSPKICPSPACKCAFNYRRAVNGTCIPTRDCPPFDCSCRPNEEFDSCPPLCPSDDCSQASPTGECPKRFGNIGIVLPCNPKCRCIKNYWRRNGTCVPYGQCPGVCPDNERYSECIQGECRALNCTQKDQSIPCVRIDPQFCKKGCVCEEGYLLAENGTCVPKDQCETNTCPVNEEYVPCIQGVCRAMDCSQKGKDVPCPDIPKEKCDSGCICKEHYLRNDDGNCVPEYQCETDVCPANEEWSTCAQATCRAQNCTEKDKPIACPLIADGYCIKACVCKSGYLRDETGNCIPEDQCPSQLICGENEDLVNCSSSCTSDYCPRSENEKQECVKSDPCKPACKCRFNFRRAANKTCIPTRSCPPFDCSARPNEEYNPCPALCPTDACGQPRLKGRCPYRIGIVLNCNPKCQCKDGYGRFNGICVPFAECPNLCPTNEEYSPCVEATCRPQNCSQRDDEIGTCPTCEPESCQRGCVCKKDYYRNDKGVCVSYEQCGAPLCPNANEHYEKNLKPCPPNTCVSLVSKYNCDENQKEEPGCLCDSGYLRLNTTCVPICECPEMANSPDC